MQTRALPILFASALALAPLAGCNRQDAVISTERDSQGNTSVHVNGDKVDQNFKQSQKDLEAAGQQASEQIKEGAQQVGSAIERGAQKVDEKVGPVAREVLSDAALTAEVKARLVADPQVAALHIDVDTVDGRVTLNGKVSSEAEKADAERLASRTDGVVSVVNLIQVVGEPAPTPKVVPGPGGH